jgi:hypothetical protein
MIPGRLDEPDFRCPVEPGWALSAVYSSKTGKSVSTTHLTTLHSP